MEGQTAKLVSFDLCLYTDKKRIPHRPPLVFWERYLRSIPKYSAATD